MDKQTKKLFWDTVNRFDRFLLCLHVNADADSLCSNIAMSELLVSRGKSVTILAGKNTTFSKELVNLNDWLKIVSNHSVEEIDFGQYDCFIMLDAHNEERLYDTKDMPLPKIVIDHHRDNQIQDAEFKVVLSNYSSTAEMIYDLASSYISLSDDFLLAVYMGIYGDTAGFKYNVRSAVHEICSEICRRVDPSKLVLDYNKTLEAYDLDVLSIAISNLKQFKVSNLSFGVTTLPMKDVFEKIGFDKKWSSNVATKVLSDVNDLDVLCIASEREPGVWRIRFRSFVNGSHARILAETFKGGGHDKASGGVFYNNEPRAVVAKIKESAEKLFS